LTDFVLVRLALMISGLDYAALEYILVTGLSNTEN